MKINKLRLKGFIGIKRGLGLDEIEIDFSNIDGLIAFAGQNGLGKSTILENLHPFSTLASRSGALYNHCFRRDSEKELSFTYNGSRYRTLLKIDCQSGKSEGFIYKNGSTKSETTGKIREYDKYIVGLLGTENMFFHSVFCAQNSTKLSDMSTGELKTLLSEFLNLDKLAGWEAESKEKITATTGNVEQVEKQLLILNNRLTGFNDINTLLAKSKEELTTCETSIEDLKKKRVEYQLELESLRDQKSKQEVLIAQKANIEKQIEATKAQLFREQNDADAELNTLRDAYKSLQAQITGNEELLAKADEINAAAEKEKEIQKLIDSLTEKIDELTRDGQGQSQTAHDLETKISTLNQNLKSIETDPENLRLGKIIEGAEREVEDRERMINTPPPELEKLKADVEGLQRAAQVGEGIDAACQSKTCAAIRAINEAKERLPEVQAALQKMVDALADRKTELSHEIADIKQRTSKVCDEKAARLEAINKSNEETSAEISKANQDLSNAKKIVDATNEAINKQRQDLATLRFDIGKVKDLAGKKTALEVAKSQYESVTKQMEENCTKGKELKVKWESRKNDLDGSIKDAEASLADIEKQIDKDVELRIIQIQKVIGAIDEQLMETERGLNETRALIMKYEAELSSKAAVEKELKAANDEKARLQQDISDWTYLRNACGKNGLQAMEIDGAAPIITSFANDLLTQAFGPLFTVKFRTINDEGKECLDIIVISDDGEEILLDNLSGGQKVWCLMALRLAMTLLSKEKSGKNFETFFSDEMDGALDPENALNFVNMYRSFMTAGGFKDGYFISHKPSCRALADNNLMFEAGSSPAWQ